MTSSDLVAVAFGAVAILGYIGYLVWSLRTSKSAIIVTQEEVVDLTIEKKVASESDADARADLAKHFGGGSPKS